MSCVAPHVWALLDALRAVADNRPFVVVNEYLGYLPFGAYSHIEVDGIDVSASLPSFSTGELEVLVQAGALEELDHRKTSSEETRTTFRVR